MPKKSELGQMLVDEGLLSKQQLQEAVYNQVIFGGRLGTNLLELGFLDEESLARYLARQHRVKTVKLSDLAGINPVVIKMIPKKLAEKYQVIPLRLEGNKLYVVMSDPSQMGVISELSFVTGKVIVPLVLPEVRIYELLNQHYGLGRELRYINIAMMEAERRRKQSARVVAKITPVKKKAAEDEAREKLKEKIISGKDRELISEKEFEAMTTDYYLKKETVPTQQNIVPEEQALTKEEDAAGQAPSGADEVVELDEEVVELKPLSQEPELSFLPEPERISGEPFEEPEPEIPRLSFAQATKELMENTRNRDDLAKAVLGFAQGFFKRAVLFTVRDDQIFGWFGIGPGIKIRQVQQLLIPLTEPSVFKTVVDASCHYLGPMTPQPENDKFLQNIGGEKPNSVFLIPIIWQTKVVYVLYGDNGQGQNAPFDIGELLILAQKLPAAIERLIDEKKKQYHIIQGGKQ